jgi:hypothetical protein
MNDNDIINLLDSLHHKLSKYDSDEFLKQELTKPTLDIKKIPVLKKGCYHELSPYLKVRFEYAGRWVNAGVSHTWLSYDDMVNSWDDNELQELIDMRFEYYEDSIIQQYEDEDISLFAAAKDLGEETYILWDDNSEPKILMFTAHSERLFSTFKEYLNFLLDA